MQRTVYFSEKTEAVVAALVELTGKSVSAIIAEALENWYNGGFQS